MKLQEIEVFVVVDAAGDYGVGPDADVARTAYSENIQPLEECDGYRLLRISLQVPLPTVAELSGVVPALGEPGKLIVKGGCPGGEDEVW